MLTRAVIEIESFARPRAGSDLVISVRTASADGGTHDSRIMAGWMVPISPNEFIGYEEDQESNLTFFFLRDDEAVRTEVKREAYHPAIVDTVHGEATSAIALRRDAQAATHNHYHWGALSELKLSNRTGEISLQPQAA